MRQLIARVDDDLHALLKAKAAAQGRSLNAFVNELLSASVEGYDARRALRARAELSGRRRTPPRPSRVPSWKTVTAATRGSGSAATDALTAERAAR